jgi:hypothetical protein
MPWGVTEKAHVETYHKQQSIVIPPSIHLGTDIYEPKQ